MNARALAAKLLYQVIYQQRSLRDIFLNELDKVSPEDSAFVKDICFGALRWHYPINALLEALLVKPLKQKDRDVECLLRVGLYQLVYQDTPDHAAVNETVKASRSLKKKWSKGLINGVLRGFLRNKDSFLKELEGEVSLSSPSWFKKRLKKAWPEQWQSILNANNQRAPMALRVNLSRQDRDEYLAVLKQVGIEADPHPWVKTSVHLKAPVAVTELPHFFQGHVSVQDSAAQLAASLLDVKKGSRVLDACAAPGGKTGHLLEYESDMDLVALDSDAKRLERIRENLNRLGQSAKLLIADANETEKWHDQSLFDAILLDAPCSATGVIRRHPDIKVLRKASDVTALVEQQKRLLESMWAILKPGGKLLYATCSILPVENEKQIQAFLDHHDDAEVLPIEVQSPKHVQLGLQIFPGHDDMDGFYYCLLKKAE